MKAAFAWIGGILAVIVVVALIAIGGWKLHWWMAKATVQNQYVVNTQTQQYQAGLISQERDNVLAWNKAVDPGQKQAISDQFCAIFQSLSPAPADLVSARSNICN